MNDLLLRFLGARSNMQDQFHEIARHGIDPRRGHTYGPGIEEYDCSLLALVDSRGIPEPSRWRLTNDDREALERALGEEGVDLPGPLFPPLLEA